MHTYCEYHSRSKNLAWTGSAVRCPAVNVVGTTVDLKMMLGPAVLLFAVHAVGTTWFHSQ
jgi:hypothetical protein